MADMTPTGGGSDAALRQAAVEERRLIERERRAEQRFAKAMDKLARAERKLARAQARLTRRTQEVAKAEARLRERQQARAAGPMLDGARSSAATRLAPSDTVDRLAEAAHPPEPVSAEERPTDAMVVPVGGDGTNPDEAPAPPQRSRPGRPTPPRG